MERRSRTAPIAPASGRCDIWILPLSGDSKPFAFQNSGVQDTHPQVSPDGNWIAYSSTETGVSEIYVRSFPGGSAKRIVSTGGGRFARWRDDGKELFYWAGATDHIRGARDSVGRGVPRKQLGRHAAALTLKP